MRRTGIKCICAILCVLSLLVGIAGCVCSAIWYSGPNRSNFYESSLCWGINQKNLKLIEDGIELWKGSEAGVLTKYEQQRLTQIKSELSSVQTNFRFAVYQDGAEGLLFNNAGDARTWKSEVYNTNVRTVERWEYTENSGTYDNWWVDYRIEFGVLYPLSAQDEYREGQDLFYALEQYMPAILALSIGCLVFALLMLVCLFCVCGRRKGSDAVYLNLQDRIPYDVYLVIQITLNGVCWGLFLVEGVNYLNYNDGDWFGVFWVSASVLVGIILVLAFLLSTATRIKARVLLRNTLIAKLFHWIKRGISSAYRNLPMVWRAVAIFAAYLAGTVLSAATIILALPYQAIALYLICRWVMQWKQIREVTQAIVAGQPEAKIETDRFYPDLKEHAQQLNDLGVAIDNAVDERMKSERFKAELITNVSHDLKTPLTSIINYVDLLKKEEISNETAREYIEVLDRKSQRLKKLTEDLVEAAKASTGALNVEKERLDVVQLIRQATGEYEEKLEAAGLSLVVTLPDAPAYIYADGRHVWRVLDNLLSNCAKYALEGTRIYLDAVVWNGNAVITVKNVSRNPLNIPAEQLVERFVRGDESRTTEGSGLGLSIARSLTELQGGQFLLDIDGDLFKAKILLPLAE